MLPCPTKIKDFLLVCVLFHFVFSELLGSVVYCLTLTRQVLAFFPFHFTVLLYKDFILQFPHFVEILFCDILTVLREWGR